MSERASEITSQRPMISQIHPARTAVTPIIPERLVVNLEPTTKSIYANGDSMDRQWVGYNYCDCDCPAVFWLTSRGMQRHQYCSAWSRQPVDPLQFLQLFSRRLNISPRMTLYVGIANALAENDRHSGNAPLVRSSFCPAFAQHLDLDSRG
ncbi:hypothetical protein M430DRAFT_22656 [Amorphotheca resinae ATCC 22711]|uniref:Uncharacterized protein n=1 Tax=Amorphotheca resinae ATCC 22711 TaxID=857342 RepID=A0A2T3ASF6_AMORE|nr:hypothetical protein M430DRAFT_22656 [Amorphotheca resinae ATCC 22711]PSS09296.1 hypothetical protein M430DRAFT_22656 [Amorphotheca resinae ATCC 22711]